MIPQKEEGRALNMTRFFTSIPLLVVLLFVLALPAVAQEPQQSTAGPIPGGPSYRSRRGTASAFTRAMPSTSKAREARERVNAKEKAREKVKEKAKAKAKVREKARGKEKVKACPWPACLGWGSC